MARYGSIFLLMALGGPAVAVDNMRFSGTLIEPPPCTINDGGEVEVSFGTRVGVSKVDGVNYLKPVGYRITCDPGAGAWNMTLEVVGTPADYDEAAIESNVDNLAIRLLQNGKLFTLNKPIPIKLNSVPTLEAVPVKRPGATLKEGAFEATATLLAVYQ
ncbi:TPA: fimbrial protein [Serratia fonticola]|jgi:type 1 fimbria pilin|uniref:Putative minor fimbrial subunit StfF n=1 Tax=Serratia fonticola TaxID=47917 RepID=A0A448SE97_SERFO|nr:fimbrial protein [Serratia fonticola]CAI0778748.1 putative minor fimbrial subunit StfF [Serratia fonticola]CAI0779402.1 putative minor fimbrial subunit StfF [Serratia fonticola]CAI0906913.1 putative minor fimbrial subunit StfF [Serratia fonticola]CAI1517523.1 putative minor fimbrial subunit StfF [Serratia fonticola]CAI1609330.1 putative minor fimbrial subunit StfF [Serratia fonticola]